MENLQNVPMDPTAMFKLSYGLFVLSAREGEKDNGCIINTVTQVTTSPCVYVPSTRSATPASSMITPCTRWGWMM